MMMRTIRSASSFRAEYRNGPAGRWDRRNGGGLRRVDRLGLACFDVFSDEVVNAADLGNDVATAA